MVSWQSIVKKKNSVSFIQKCLFDVPSSERNSLRSRRERCREKELLNVDKHVMRALAKDKRPSAFLCKKGRCSLVLSYKRKGCMEEREEGFFREGARWILKWQNIWAVGFWHWYVPHCFFPGFKEFRKTCGVAIDKNKDHPVAAQSTAGTVMQTIYL